MFYLLITLLGWLIILTKIRRDYLRAHDRYLISYHEWSGIYTVRDKRGRFVCITNNYWDICKLGA